VAEDAERDRMVREQLEARDIRDARLLEAMRRVPRHLFVPEAYRDHAYQDSPQPIGNQQTISQPLMVAAMTQLLCLTGEEKVLEIGTGSGYQTAILAELAKRVISIERLDALSQRARGLLEWLGYRNIEIHCGDGTAGYPPDAPYDRIIVTAGAPQIPQPLMEQLACPGRMVIPVGGMDMQYLCVVIREIDGATRTEDHGPCVFVPLVGVYGWHAPPPPNASNS
jgi:protein-L-isoaspartate(D-aspartate) O-methyltransferase